MKYICCYCSKLFNVKEAIDGYDHGFKKGFICPYCNKNIDESRESLLKDFVLIVGSLFIALCGLPGAGRIGIPRDVVEPFWEVIYFGIGAAVFFGVIALIKGYIRSKRPIKTKPPHEEYT